MLGWRGDSFLTVGKSNEKKARIVVGTMKSSFHSDVRALGLHPLPHTPAQFSNSMGLMNNSQAQKSLSGCPQSL